jgi:hypothetical protein
MLVHRRFIAPVAVAVTALIVFATPAYSDTPNPALTPGAINSAVTQANIGSTICSKGYATSVRNVSNAVKHQVYAEYHIGRSQQRRYVIDHLIPLEVGGANALANLWPELKSESKVKDKLENALHGDVCRGDLTLADAQHIATGPVDVGLTTAVGVKGAAKRVKQAADTAAAQAEQQRQQQIAAYIAAQDQQRLQAYLQAVAAQQAQQRAQQQQSSSSSSGGEGTTSGGGGGGGGPVVHPGAFCAPAGARGVTTAGTPMVCGPASDGRNRWHSG